MLSVINDYGLDFGNLDSKLLTMVPAVHGLPYKKNGGTKMEKSDDNALAMMQSIEDMHMP